MKRFHRSDFMLPVAVSAILIALAVLIAPRAGAQSLPADAEAGRGEKFQFKLPYEPGKAYQFRQTLRLEARTGEYSPDDLAMDIRQVISATVRLDANASGVLTAHIDHLVQRGNDSGRYCQLDCTGLDEILPRDYSNNKWQHRMVFQADIDGCGKLSNPRGAVQAHDVQDPKYINHPAIAKQNAYRDAWFRQFAEEPTLYLPPGKVAVGEKWTHTRTVHSFTDLYLLPAGTVGETIHCRLASVADTPQGRVATIEVSGVIGQDAPGQTCLKRVGLVRYNLDSGALVEHRLAVTGILIRQNRKPAEITATLAVCLAPATGNPAEAALPACLPVLDRDGEDVFVYDRRTKIVQDHTGKIWTLPAKPANPAEAEKQARLNCPVEVCDPSKGVSGKAPQIAYQTMMVDLAGRPWWSSRAYEATLTWIEAGKYQTRKIEGYHSYNNLRFPTVHGLTGHDVYCDAGGEIFFPGRAKLQIYGNTGWKEMDIPCHLGDLRTAQQQGAFMRRVGKTVYLARNFEASMDASCTILAYEAGVLCDTGIVSSQQVAFLGSHDGKILIGTSNRLWFIQPIDAKPTDTQDLARLIDKLFEDSYKVRQEAATEFEKAGRAGIEVLQKAIDRTDDAERKLRLKTVLKKLKTRPSARLIPTKLGGFEALDFVFQARGGMQFYRPWEEGKLQAEGFLLCTDGGKEVRKVNLPRQDRLFQLQLETPDGKIIGRDSRCVFELDLKTLAFRDLFALGKFAKSRPVRVVAATNGLYCLAVDESTVRGESVLYFWYNPASKSKAALLPGRAIADGVSHDTNHEPDLGIVPGLDGRLWFLRQAGIGASRLAFAEGGNVTTLTPRLAVGPAALLPLKQHAVLVLPQREMPVLLHLGETVIAKPRIQDLISDNYRQMVDLVPEAAPYRTGDSYDFEFLLRMGDDFWLKESYMERHSNGASIKTFKGLYAGQNWQDCDIGRIVGMDPARRRVLAYDENCRNLFWSFSQEGSLKTDTVTGRDYSFGWCWYDQTNLPYYRPAMILTEAAIDQMKEKLIAADDDNVKAEDCTGFRMWDGSGWVNWEGTLWGGTLYTDETGGIWCVRRRDVLVQLKDGRRQRLDLDDALHEEYTNLVQERPGVVWLATDQSVVRLVSDCKDGVFGPYRVERRFSTRSYGYDIRGPWIIGGKDFYFASGGVLYHVSLAELLKGA